MEKSIRRLIKIKFDCILRWFTGSLSNSNTKKEPTSSPLCYYNPLTLVDTLTKWVIQRSQSCHGVRTETRSRYLWHRSLTPFNYMSSPLHTDNSSIWIPYRTVKTRGLVKTLDWKSQGFSCSWSWSFVKVVLKSLRLTQLIKFKSRDFSLGARIVHLANLKTLW